MTKKEAIVLCRSGQKITHGYFSDDEFVEYKDGQFVTEDGCRMGRIHDKFWTIRTGGFWEDNWCIYESKV